MSLLDVNPLEDLPYLEMLYHFIFCEKSHYTWKAHAKLSRKRLRAKRRRRRHRRTNDVERVLAPARNARSRMSARRARTVPRTAPQHWEMTTRQQRGWLPRTDTKWLWKPFLWLQLPLASKREILAIPQGCVVLTFFLNSIIFYEHSYII